MPHNFVYVAIVQHWLSSISEHLRDGHIGAGKSNSHSLNDTFCRTVVSRIWGNISCLHFPLVVYKSSTFQSVRFTLNCHLSSGLSRNCSLYVSQGNQDKKMEVMEGNIQEAMPLTIRPHRSQAPLSSYSLWVSGSRWQSFKRLLGAARLPQLLPLLSACRVQRLHLYYLVNPGLCLPKSLAAALCIPWSVR